METRLLPRTTKPMKGNPKDKWTSLIHHLNEDFLKEYFQSGKEAEEFSKALKERLGRYGLKTSENKSKIIEFGRYAWQKAKEQGKGLGTFDFLGFTHYCDKTRKGKFKLGRKTSMKKFIQKVKAMNVWLKKVRNMTPLKEWWKVLKMKLTGHYRYYGISGNMQTMRLFYIEASKLAYKWDKQA